MTSEPSFQYHFTDLRFELLLLLLLFSVWRCRLLFVYVRISAKLTALVFVSVSNYTELITSKSHETFQTFNIL